MYKDQGNSQVQSGNSQVQSGKPFLLHKCVDTPSHCTKYRRLAKEN